jgi:hypothetical protein
MKRLVLSLLCGLLSISSSEAANIIFVSFHGGDNAPSAAAVTAGFTQAPDVGYTQLLAANGHTVTRMVTLDNAGLSAATLNAADLVILSRSVPSGHYQTDAETAFWNGITAPTLVLGAYILRGGASGNVRLGYMATDTIPDITSSARLRVRIPSHPVFAGVSLDSVGVTVNPYANMVSYTNTPQRGVSVITGATAGNGTVLATIATAGDPANGGMVIGEWLAGATMNTTPNGGPADILAGHRLVLLTGSRENAAITGGAPALTSEAAGIYDLTADGAQLLLNAVNYMTSTRIAIRQVDTVNNESPGANETSLLEALTSAQDGDYIRFAIPGAGPHVIQTPMGGYPLITAHNLTIDGYTQAGATPNTRGILEGNNAALRIVLDSSGTDTAPNPTDPSLPLHRSTRLAAYEGYSPEEDAILPVLAARNFKVRGISFVSRYAEDTGEDPNVYCVAFVNVPTGATGGHVSGCWFGLRPDGSSLRGGRASVATFLNGTEDASGLVIGTNGDGVDDRAEFNIHAAMSLACHLQTPNVKVSGNYINVLPGGNTFVNVDAVAREIGAVQDPGNPDPSPATVEFLENANCTNVVIGTDGNGVADADERNIVANVSYSETMEFWRAADNVVVAGNYFGVGVDGVTASPVSAYEQPDFLRFGRPTSSVRIGSNGDGVSDDIEPNLIVNMSGDRFINMSQGGSGDINEVSTRRNVFRNCSFHAVPFANAQTAHQGYYADVVADSTAPSPVLTGLAGGILRGKIAPGNLVKYPFAFIDVYIVDSAALANTADVWPLPRTHPSRWLGTYTDNGPGDQDPANNQFAIDLSSVGLPDATYVTVGVTYSTEATASNVGLAVTSPMSNPISRRPSLGITLQVLGNAELSWLAADGAFQLQVSNDLGDPGSWFPIGTGTYNGGRNIVQNPHDPFSPGVFFRLISVP